MSDQKSRNLASRWAAWPKYEVLRYLKARTRGLSVHLLDDFIRMHKDKNFAYRVLRGDADFVLHVLLEFGYLSQKRIAQSSPPPAARGQQKHAG